MTQLFAHAQPDPAHSPPRLPRRRRYRRRARARHVWARRRPLHRRRRRFPRRRNFKYFHARFHTVLTADWPAAPKVPQYQSSQDADDDKTTPLLWNFDHLTFSLSSFLVPGHGAGSYQHSPPFRFFKIKKIVVKGTWINWTAKDMENAIGTTALDLDGEDANRGNATRSPLDPGKPPGLVSPPPDPNKAPFLYDPLANRTSARAWRLRRGFTRVFRPKPQMTEPIPQHPATHWLTRRTPWVSVREGADLAWNGLSISLRQLKDPLNEDPVPPLPSIQYDIKAYVLFKEFDYEPGRQPQ